MSADNWRICPKCDDGRVAAKADAVMTAVNAYGTVPVEQWKALQAKADHIPPAKDTLREDYEIGTDHTGEFYVSYSCSCQECGFRFEFEARRNVFQQSGGSNP